MNFPSADPDEPSNPDFELILEDANEPESESPAKPATNEGPSLPRPGTEAAAAAKLDDNGLLGLG
jgi:hypothetical protein